MTRALTSDAGQAGTESSRSSAFAMVIAGSLFLPIPGITQLSAGAFLVLGAAPVIVPPLLSTPMGRRLAVVFGAVVVALPITVMTSLALQPQRGFDSANFVRDLCAVISLCTAVTGTCYAFRHAGIIKTVLAAALGVLGAVALNPEVSAENVWKYGISWPVCVIALITTKKLPATIRYGALVGLGAVSLLNETRNTAAVLFAVLLVDVLSRFRLKGARPVNRWVAIVLLLAAAWLVSSIVSAIALSGVAGQNLQAREMAQNQVGIFGGRVEYGATFALMLEAPLGIGAGVSPSATDIDAGQAGIESIGADATAPYVTHQVLGSRIELHSIAGDLWLIGGPIGAIAAFVGAASLIGGVIDVRRIPDTTIRPLIAFVLLQSAWDWLFSPLIVNGPLAGLALALCLTMRASSFERPEVGLA